MTTTTTNMGAEKEFEKAAQTFYLLFCVAQMWKKLKLCLDIVCSTNVWYNGYTFGRHVWITLNS